MKYLIALALSATLLSGCGNRTFFDTHWTFKEAIVRSPDGSCETVTVLAWRDYDQSDMIQIVTPNKAILTHSSNILLIKNKH